MRRSTGAARAAGVAGAAGAVCVAWAASLICMAEAHAAGDALLVVKSDPPGAAVCLNNETEPRGTTPCVLNVEPGRYVLRAVLRQPGRELRGEAPVDARADRPAIVEIELSAPDENYGLPQRSQRTPRIQTAGGSVGSVASVFAGFDSLIDKGDFAGARRHMERARGKDAEIVRAATRLADGLEARRRAIAAGATALSGQEAGLRTTRGKLSGEVADVTDEGVVLVVKKKLRGAGTIETRIKVRWSDLTPDQEDEFARTGGWRPGGADGGIARAYLALGRKDASAAQRSLAAAGDHPLAAHLRQRLEAPGREASARAAWAAIEGKAGAKELSASQARSLLRRIAAFERDHADTDFAATVAKELAAVKARAEAAGALLLGLVGWWRFDEGRGNVARDSSGRGNHGTVEGGARWVRGRLGGALELDGTDDCVEVGSVGVSGAAPRTIAGWVRATRTSGPGWVTVFGFSPEERVHGSYFDMEGDNNGNYTLHVCGKDYDICAVDLGWHHLAGTYDGSTMARYLDGNLVGTVRRTLDTKDAVLMGVRASNSRHFHGLIDDVRIYDRALTAEEIRALASQE